mmetsp:Transcript_39213/g.70333  ORF Transcript_39213/g.70333 Transcript_39213/m.70333 type:complete len:630 (-) Transcript_39213:27-1916(-)
MAASGMVFLYVLSCLLIDGAAQLSSTPTPTTTNPAVWRTTPSVINPDQKFTISIAHPTTVWNDADLIGFARQKIDILEVTRHPDTWSDSLPGIIFCNSSTVDEPLAVKTFGQFLSTGGTRRTVVFSNIVQKSGQYSVCYYNGFEWLALPQNLIVLGPAAHTTQPTALIVDTNFQLWIYGEQLSSGDQWGFTSPNTPCENEQFTLQGTLTYEEINFPLATRAIINAGVAPAAGYYDLCYKYRTATWGKVVPPILVETETLRAVGAHTREDGSSLDTGFVILFIILGLLICVAGTFVWYRIWLRHDEKLEALQQQKTPGINQDLMKSGMGSPKLLMSPMGLPGGEQNQLLQIHGDSPDMAAPMVQSMMGGTTGSPRGMKGSPHSGGSPRAYSSPVTVGPNGVPTGAVAVDGAVAHQGDPNTQYYYDPTTGNYWAYVQNADGSTAPAGAPMGSPNKPGAQALGPQPGGGGGFTGVMPDVSGGLAPGFTPGGPQYMSGTMGPNSAVNPLMMSNLGLNSTMHSVTSTRPTARKGNWVKPGDSELTALEQMRLQKRKELQMMGSTMGSQAMASQMMMSGMGGGGTGMGGYMQDPHSGPHSGSHTALESVDGDGNPVSYQPTRQQGTVQRRPSVQY